MIHNYESSDSIPYGFFTLPSLILAFKLEQQAN